MLPRYLLARSSAVILVFVLACAFLGFGASSAYAADFVHLLNWGSAGNGNGQFNFPNDVSVDTSGGVYVTVRDDNPATNDRLEKFDANGNWIWTQTGFYHPECMAVRAGVLYVCDSDNNRVRTLDASSGVVLNNSWASGYALAYPSGIAFDAAGNCYVGSYSSNRIVKYSSTGVMITNWANPTTGGIAIDASGNVLATSYGSAQLNCYNNTGTLLWSKGTLGAAAGQFNQPWGLSTDGLGNIYVADTTNNRVQKFDRNGNFISQWGTPEGAGFSSPGSLDIDKTNALMYVADGNNNRIQKFQLPALLVKQGADGGRPSAKVFRTASATSVVDEISMTALCNTLTVGSITIRGLDASTTLRSDVASVTLFRDNGDGVYGAGDTLLSSTTTFSADTSGTAITFSGVNSAITTSSPAAFWIVYKIGSAPGDTHEVGSRMLFPDVTVASATVLPYTGITSANGGRTIGIDLQPPSTTATGIPPGWSNGATVTLNATDTYSGVANSYYSVNGGAATTYTTPAVISIEGTDTLRYWSVDVAGNVEASHSATLKIDTSAPTTPTSVTDYTDTTSTVTLSWGASTDAVSGLAGYQILVNGVLATQTVNTSCTVTGLTSGSTYSFVVQAVDLAGNTAAAAPVTETVPTMSEYIQLSITTPSAPQTVSFGTIDPTTSSTVSSAVTATVSGFTALSYTLSSQSADFLGSLGATMPASLLSYRMYGTASLPWTASATTSQTLAVGTGVHGRWQRSYFFDYQLPAVGYAYPADRYSQVTVYTVVAN